MPAITFRLLLGIQIIFKPFRYSDFKDNKRTKQKLGPFKLQISIFILIPEYYLGDESRIIDETFCLEKRV